MPIEVAVEVRDILANPPSENPYDALKAAILSRVSLSERQHFQHILSAEELGDRRPSQLLRELQSLYGNTAPAMDSTLLKHIFLQRLPPSVQMILATASDLPLPALAARADKILEVAALHAPMSTLASAQSADTTAVAPAATLSPPVSNNVAALQQRMQNLEEPVGSAAFDSSLTRDPRARWYRRFCRPTCSLVSRQGSMSPQEPQPLMPFAGTIAASVRRQNVVLVLAAGWETRRGIVSGDDQFHSQQQLPFLHHG